MNQEQLSKFKALFEKQRNEIIATRSLLDEEFTLKKDDCLDEVDLTTTEMEQNMRMRLRHRENFYLRKLDGALRRIQDGTFGECESCEEEIGLRRLEARPTATMCVSCKEEQERSERTFADNTTPKSEGVTIRLRA